VAGTIAQIWRYPVKSMAGERLESTAITSGGLEGDRRWTLVDGSPNRAGKMLTNTQDARLMTYKARLVGEGVEVMTPTGQVERLGNGFVAQLAEAVARPLTLRDSAGINFDDSHVLIVNLSTVAAFALAAGADVDPRRFRANFFVEGLEPEEEVRWVGQRIRAGSARLEVVKRCERCAVVTRHPETTETSPALLRVLTETSDTCMGVYCRVIQPGQAAVGDLIGPD
jgi:uncharacterized protein YcbX